MLKLIGKEMNDIKIRQANLDDIAKLLEFEQGVIAAERPFDKTLVDQKITYYDLAGLINVDDAELVVAEIDGKLIGSGYAKLKKAKSYVKHDYFSYLGFMYVDPAYRGKGINKLILTALAQWSNDQGVDEICLEVYAENQAAIRAYEKAGFAKSTVLMRLE